MLIDEIASYSQVATTALAAVVGARSMLRRRRRPVVDTAEANRSAVVTKVSDAGQPIDEVVVAFDRDAETLGQASADVAEATPSGDIGDDGGA
jgi:hypothetical protein